MENTTSTLVGQWFKNKLSGTPDQPLSEPAIKFGLKILPMLGVTSVPDTNVTAVTISTTSKNMASTIDETTISGRAESRMQYEGTKQQQNLESISSNALPFIKEDAKPDDVDEDWLTNFFDKGRLVSNEEMQKLWSHILAGEVNNPGSFSPITLHTLSIISKKDALLFKKLCSYVWIDDEAIPVAVLPGVVLSNKELIGMNANDTYHLVDIGLIKYSTHEYIIGSDKLDMSYHGRQYNIRNKDAAAEDTKVDLFKVGYVDLTLAGRELFAICAPEPNWEYMKEILNHWTSRDYEFTELIIE